MRYGTVFSFLFCILMPVVLWGQVRPETVFILTNFEYNYPNWSPEINKLAFTSDMLGDNSEIYIMNTDGSDMKRLTFNDWDDLSPVWSPDGTKIVFGSIRESGNHDVYLMNADGSTVRNLTNSPNSLDNHPKFTPDGQTILFNSSRDTPEEWPESIYDYELYEMRQDGSGLKRLTFYPEGWDSYPSVSPDGQQLLWRRIVPLEGEERGNSEIFIANRDGDKPKNISNHPAFDGYPAWSPDGSKIVFASSREKGGKSVLPSIFMMDPDGEYITALTQPSFGKADVRPWFSPSGKYLVFNRIYMEEDRTEIVMIKIPGT